MEKLNEYLQTLLSACGYELHLEPNKQPFVVSSSGTTQIANMPLLGTQISTMIFPLIPLNVRQELPNKSEVEFTHTHNLGEFTFQVRKSPSGFNVTIRPMLPAAAVVADDASPAPEDLLLAQTMLTDEIEPAHSSPIFNNSSSNQNVPFFNSSSEAPAFIQESSETQNSVLPDAPLATGEIFFDQTPITFADEESLLPAQSEQPPQAVLISAVEPEIFTGFYDPSQVDAPAAAAAATPAQQENNAAQSQSNFTQQEISVPPQQPATFHSAEQTFDEAHFVSQPLTQAQSKESQFSNFVPAQANSQTRAQMDAMFRRMAEIGASDLHLSVSMPPLVRKDGKIQPLSNGVNDAPLDANTLRELLISIMPAKNQEEFAHRNDSDFAYEIPGLARFRANIFMDRKGMGGVFRIIPSDILTAEQLNLSPAIMNLCDLSKGLVLVTGPTGSGKSTTLCAMIDSINRRREDHIITIEDPIEFTHENQKCLVNQREVGNHTDSFKDALRAALREDPDILLVGEMRDLETISIAIETAETGHLVFGTLHTTTAASTVDRIIDQFPADRQQQIRVMLSESLKGVISQTLLPKKGGGRVAALEVLIVTPAISNLIREGKTFQIPSAMQTGKTHGMVVLNDALFALVQKGVVEPRDAYLKAIDKLNFGAMLERGGFKIYID